MNSLIGISIMVFAAALWLMFWRIGGSERRPPRLR